MKFHRVLYLVAGLAAVCASGQTNSTRFSTGQAARLVIGQTNFTSGDYGASNKLLGSPSGLAFSNGTLWVVDANRLGALPSNHRVLGFTDTGSYPTATQDPSIKGSLCGVCRGNASVVLGQPDFATTTNTLTAAGMRTPNGVATDGTILVVADTDNNRVLIWKTIPTRNGQTADVVIGQKDFTHGGTSVPPTAASLRGPEGVWLANGKLFIADSQDNRVLIFNQIPNANGAAADVVIGQPGFTSFVQQDLTQSTVTPKADNLQTPVSVTTDGQRMYVADLGQNRILIWNRIPTTNGAAADIALGQPDLISATPNNSFTITGTAVDSVGYPTGAAGALCKTTGSSSAGTPYFPVRCGATLSLPRFALSDGKRLFVADGGNDRVLVYESIPTKSGQAPDSILGQPDEYSDNASRNPDGANAFQTPTSLAWDATSGNLYVSDTYNRRVSVFSPGPLNIPLGSIFNAASQQIYAIGSVLITGGINAKDTVTITISGTNYVYTVVATDTFATVAQGLAKIINAIPDPNVTATVNTATATVILTAKKPGLDGAFVGLSVGVSNGAQITPTASGASLNINLQDPSSIAPGTVISIYGSNLCDSTQFDDLSHGYLPFTLAGCELFADGVRVPLILASPTQLNAEMPWSFNDRSSVSMYLRTTHKDGSVTATAPVAVTIVPQNPGVYGEDGTDPRRGFVFHASSNAANLLAIGGSVHTGDVAAITIADATYSYTVVEKDTLGTIQQALIDLINTAPDPNVTAAAANQYNNIVLTSRQKGLDGEGTKITVAVTGNNATLALNVVSATMCCSNTADSRVTLDNPALPGEIVYLFATGLGITVQSGLADGEVFRGEDNFPPFVPVDSILTGSYAASLVSTSLVKGQVGLYKVTFQISPSATTNPATQTTIAQQTFVSNVVTFPIQVPGTAVITPSSTLKASPLKAPRSRR